MTDLMALRKIPGCTLTGHYLERHPTALATANDCDACLLLYNQAVREAALERAACEIESLAYPGHFHAEAVRALKGGSRD